MHPVLCSPMPIFFNQRGNPDTKRMNAVFAGEKMGSADSTDSNPDQDDVITDNPEGEAAMDILTERIDPQPNPPKEAKTNDQPN